MNKVKILWADDEIDHLKPQIMFLERKDYQVTAVTNGHDAIDLYKEQKFDIVLLDESMPGLTGLETLRELKNINQLTPIVMITKNEEEDLMENAIGSQIADYLIKPVKPQQILMTLKKLLDNKRLVSEKTNSAYQQEFTQLFSKISMGLDYKEWMEVYKKLVFWELKLEKTEGNEMQEVFNMQKNEANNEFVRYLMRNYTDWIQEKKEGPTFSHTLFDDMVFPNMSEKETNVLLIIDNLRFDQWKIIEPIIADYFEPEQEEMFFSILPTATQYSRNAIFAGLLPSEIAKRTPNFWRNDFDEGGKNMFEEDLLKDQLSRKHKDLKTSYTKVVNHNAGRNLVDNIMNMHDYDLNVIVYNFVDMLSHARTEMEVLKELASDENAYRSLTRSWFEHSPLFDALKKLAEKPVNLMITTDHGTMRVQYPVKVVGDKNTTTNLRYKHGKNLNYNSKEVYEIRKPAEAGLPAPNVSSAYIFSKNTDFFVYPNNYNHYVKYYRDTFQHGGISLEEVIIPFVKLRSKRS